MKNITELKQMYEQYESIIEASTLFKDISKEQLLAMVQCLNPVFKHYNKGEYVATVGKPYEGIGILLKGELNISKENQAGHKIMLTKTTPSGMFGEMIAFSEHEGWLVTVEAVTDSIVMFLDPQYIVASCSNVCQRHTILTQNLLKEITMKALHLKRKIDYLIIKSIRGKICQFLLEQYSMKGKSTFSIKMNRNEMAEFLNVSRPSMSRELAKMKDEGLIDFYMNSFKIPDVDALKEFLD